MTKDDEKMEDLEIGIQLGDNQNWNEGDMKERSSGLL